MANLEPWQVFWVALQSFQGISTDVNVLTRATAISFAEDGSHDPAAVHVNADGSRDLGLWQINDKAHPDLVGGQYGNWQDPQANGLMMLKVWQRAGGKFSPWSTDHNGAADLQMGAAHAAYLTSIGKAIGDTQSIWDQIKELANVAATGPFDPSGLESLSNTAQFFDTLGSFFSKMADPKFWISVGLVLAGGIMLIVVAFHLLKGSKIVKTTGKVASVAAKVVPV